ncbi:RNA helicase [Bacillus thuringiensis]|uniref:RNA helicase n=1 Tax=Bacillus thuringiensis TaxID=1428 RepID=UPI000BFC72E8|nr:RNA helicase [Bacillus thuringiensis]PGL61704.1 RNA helicase [Bacillus thuringiensis]
METKKQNPEGTVTPDVEKHCGIIMPIAPMDGYTADHWAEVKSIITEATKQVNGIDFKTEIVSNSDGEIDIIHKRIIQNLFNADIVICDISGRNPNVMFELGMRLTFDKPTIIIKDDVTDFIFDTGVIEHLIYPKDLRFKKIVDFKNQLASRIKITYEKSQSDPNYSTFLGNFGQFKIPTLNQEAVSDVNQIILDELMTLRNEIGHVKREVAATKDLSTNYSDELHYPAGIVEKYIANTADNRNALEIISDAKFQTHLHKKGIEISVDNIDLLERTIRNTQKRLKLNN